MEETVISEGEMYSDDVPKFLSEYQIIARKFVKALDYDSALDALSHSEELIEAVSSQGGFIDPKFVLSTLNNTAFCYYQLGKLEECASYLEGSIFNIGLLTNNNSKIRLLKYQSKASVLLVQIYKELGQEEKAQQSASKALESIKWCFESCQEHVQRHSSFSKSPKIRRRFESHEQYNLMESPHYLHFNGLVNDAIPICEFVLNALNNNLQKNTMNKEEFDTDSIFKIEWVSCKHKSDEIEFRKHSLLEKVSLCICALFYVARETKEKPASFYRNSLNLANAFFESDNKLLNTIKEEYDRLFPRKQLSVKRQKIIIRKDSSSKRVKSLKRQNLNKF